MFSLELIAPAKSDSRIEILIWCAVSAAVKNAYYLVIVLPCLLFVASLISKQAVKVTIGKFSSVVPTQSIFSMLITFGSKDR